MRSSEDVGPRDLVAALVEREIAEAQDVTGKIARRAPKDRLHARDDLGEAERLRDVVVAAGPQRLDLVLDGFLRGEEEDRRLEAAVADAATDLDAFDVGQHPVEHDEIGLEASDRGNRIPAVRRLLDVEPLVAESGRNRVDDRRLVVDDENAGRGAGVLVELCVHGARLASVPVSLL